MAVALVLGIKLFRGTLNKWLVPLNPNGRELIRKIQDLEFLENKSRYRSDEDAINSALGNGVLENHQQSYQLQAPPPAEWGYASERGRG